MRISLRVLQQQKEPRMAAPAKAYFSTYAPTAVGASILSANVGPEWSLFRRRVTLSIENHENSIITLDQ